MVRWRGCWQYMEQTRYCASVFAHVSYWTLLAGTIIAARTARQKQHRVALPKEGNIICKHQSEVTGKTCEFWFGPP
eukprot:3581604-Amphidinium_carterae.1